MEQFLTPKVSFVVDTLSIRWHFAVDAFNVEIKPSFSTKREYYKIEANEA